MEITGSSHELLQSSRTEQGSKSSRSRFSQLSNKTASSMGVDDMDLSVMGSQRALQTSDNRVGGRNGDQELVDALGGAKYLKANKKVWAMRIIVISTFVGKCIYAGGNNRGFLVRFFLHDYLSRFSSLTSLCLCLSLCF